MTIFNRLTRTVDGEVTEYSYNELNQLVSETGICYKYDKNGNLVKKTEGEQTAQVVLTRLPPFAVYHGRHGDRRYGGHAVYLDHPAVADEEDADAHDPHAKAHDKGLQPQSQKRPGLHFHEPCFKACDVVRERQRRVGYDDA